MKLRYGANVRELLIFCCYYEGERHSEYYSWRTSKSNLLQLGFEAMSFNILTVCQVEHIYQSSYSLRGGRGVHTTYHGHIMTTSNYGPLVQSPPVYINGLPQ